MTTPFALVHPGEFLGDVVGVFFHYSAQGQVGFTGLSVVKALVALFTPTELPLSALAVVGLVSALARRRPEAVVVASGALVYFVVVAAPKLFCTRNLLPLWPLLAMLAAEGLAALYAWSGALVRRLPAGVGGARWRAVTLAFLFVVSLAPTVASAAQFDTYRAGAAGTDVRQVATEWMNAHLPAGATVAIEPYDAAPDTARFHVLYQKDGLFVHPLSWYKAHGAQYVAMSDLFYRRFYANGTAFASERAVYDAMRAQWPTAQAFEGGQRLRRHRGLAYLRTQGRLSGRRPGGCGRGSSRERASVGRVVRPWRAQTGERQRWR